MGEDNSFAQSLSTKAHEQKHRDNHKAGLKDMPMSLEQFYKVCCHDEISATMCEVLQLRQEYIEAKSAKEREEIIENNPKFSYYFDAVKAGKINPLATKTADFEKEMKVIATETQKMWMETFAERYDKNHISMTRCFFNTHDYKDLKPNDANYNKARKIAYTIGGIDFSKYMEGIECYNGFVLKCTDTSIARNEMRSDVIRTLYSGGSEIRYFKDIEFKPIEGLSPSQQYRLAQHQLFVRNAMVALDEPEKYEKANYNQLVRMKYKDWEGNETKYNRFEVEVCQDFREAKREREDPQLEISAEWKKAEKRIAEQIVKESSSTIFLGKENEKKYQEELKKIYTVNGIDLRYYLLAQGQDIESLIPQETPKIIKDVENSSMKKRFQNKVSLIYDDFKKTPLKDILFRGVVSVVDTAPKQDRKKATLQNQPYKDEPKYYKWSPDKRVSEVQYAEIYDFTQPFLQTQQKQLQQNNQIAQNKAKENKMNSAIDKRKASAVNGGKVASKQKPVTKKANAQKPKTTQTKKVANGDYSTLKVIKDAWNNMFSR